MANTVAYPDLALEKFIGIDSSEDPTAFIRLLEKKISFSLGSRPTANENGQQTVYDDRRKALFGSVLRGPAAEWFDSLDAALAWEEMKTQFINRFTDGKMQYRFRIEAENLKRQPDENIKSYIHRIKTLVDKGWPTPSNANQEAITACENQRIGKYKDYFIRGLMPPGLKQKAHQAMIEDPNKSWDALQALIINKDMSLVVSAEMSGLQPPSSQTSTGTMDARFTNIEKSLNEITNMVKNHQINATYDPNNPKMKQDFTRFCNYCKKSGHTIKYCWTLKKKKENEEKPPPQPKETYAQNYPSRPKSPNNNTSQSDNRSNGQRGRSNSPYVSNGYRSRSNSYSGAVRFEAKPDKVNSLYDTLQSCNPLN